MVICCLIKTENERIVTGTLDGTISICSFNITKKKWNRDIYKQQAHYSSIFSLCILKGNRLISGGNDKIIKIWLITDNNIIIFAELKYHTNTIQKIITVDNENFISCCQDGTIRFWENSNNQFHQNTILMNGSDVISIIKLRNKDILVSCGPSTISGICFWNLKTYFKERNITGFGIEKSNGMIELLNSNIALSSNSKSLGYPIIIIDVSSYTCISMIKMNGYIKSSSSLCNLGLNTFIYVYEGKLVQIDIADYSIIFCTKANKFDGNGGVVSIENDNYLVIENFWSLIVVKPLYY